MSDFSTLQVILKVSERCNLSCTYCYYFFAGDETYKNKPPLISAETSSEVSKFLSEAAREIPFKRLLVAFHGGEPTLLKPDKLANICRDILSQVRSIPVGFQMQTNGALLNDAWMQVIEEFQIQVGVSIDGPEVENDKFRIQNNGDGSYKKVVNGLRLLQKSAKTSPNVTPPGTISVVNPTFDYRRIYRHLVDDLGVRHISFLLPDVQHDTGLPLGIPSSRYGEILCEIFDEWTKSPADVHVRNIDSLLSYFQAIRPASVPEALGGIGSRTQVIVIQSDGELSIDDTYMVALDWRMSQDTPSVKDVSLKEYLSRDIFEEVRAHQRTLPGACSDCAWKRICRGGDLENRYSKARGFDNPSVFCDGLKMFYRHVLKYLLNNGYPRMRAMRVLGIHEEECKAA